MSLDHKHTPAPWVVRIDGSIDARAFDGSWKNICDKVRGGSPEQAKANKLLISVAPDLLESCKAAFHALKSYEHGNSATDLAAEIAELLANVIAKAEGRS